MKGVHISHMCYMRLCDSERETNLSQLRERMEKTSGAGNQKETQNPL